MPSPTTSWASPRSRQAVLTPPAPSYEHHEKETEMSNSFDDDTARFLVLVNDEGQHSLWPVFADVPAGWTVAYGEDDRQSCLAYIEKSWTDMRPKSLADAMAAEEAAS
jgi:MbtH protein